eukprot:361255-Chlamydomonas_euryale.AAC.12
MQVCKYIDIPLQHINNMTLLGMNRPPQVRMCATHALPHARRNNRRNVPAAQFALPLLAPLRPHLASCTRELAYPQGGAGSQGWLGAGRRGQGACTCLPDLNPFQHRHHTCVPRRERTHTQRRRRGRCLSPSA